MYQTRFPLRSILITIIPFLLVIPHCLTYAQPAKADAAPPPDPTVGGIGPYRPLKTNVQMMSETVFIDVPRSPSNVQEPKQIKVNATFNMRNQGKTEEQMQVIFPLTRLNTVGTEEALYQIDTSSFIAKVKGRQVPFTTITTPAEATISDMYHGFSSDVQWAAFEVTFPVQEDVLLQVEYEMLNPYGEYGEGFTGISYILETGAGWYGNILSADITLRLPYPVTEDAIVYTNPGYVSSGREMHWKLKDFEPTRQDNLAVSVVHLDAWQNILGLRARVEESPVDADTWAELGDAYMALALFIREGMVMGDNPRFVELTIEARQKAVELRPGWGDAHYKLAEILWLSNPSIEKKLGGAGISSAPEPSLDDPVIQQALHELQLAWSLGTKSSLLSLNEIFPEVVLTEYGVTTVTPAPPTQTLVPFSTNTALLPTASPKAAVTVSLTLIPTVSATPVTTKTSASFSNELLIVVVVIISIGAGVAIYGWKRTRAG